ncbi:MAG: ATP-dependent Clp protease adaptor ClpS [Treponema sp.]
MLETAHIEKNARAEQDSFPEPPPECRVILFNDDFTTMDFVVSILISIFDKSKYEAKAVMEEAHRSGKAVIGVYTYDIAMTLATTATARARQHGFPLKIEVERQ